MASQVYLTDETEAVLNITSIINNTLHLPPSSIEVFPLNPRFFVIGTYLLEPETGEGPIGDSETVQPSTAETIRNGSLNLWLIDERNTDVAFATQSPNHPTANVEIIQSRISTADISVTLLQTLPTPYAVLDLHFSPHDPGTCAVATSTGAVCFFKLGLTSGGHLTSIKSIQIADSSILVLSLAWKPSSSTPSMIAASLSSGQIAIFDHEFPDTTLRKVQAHSLEVWTLAWSVLPRTKGAAVLYSGGDDSALCRHIECLKNQNAQIDEEEAQAEDVYEPLSRDVKTHSAGVTAILPVLMPGSNDHELLLTGSYDEYIRLLEPAVTGKRSKVLAEKRLGGGVWRLKLLRKIDCAPGQGTRMSVLASCMHAGARVVEISRSNEGIWTIAVLAKFEEHESMNYASDACTQLDGDLGNLIFLSTSFYDRKLCIWNLNIDD